MFCFVIRPSEATQRSPTSESFARTKRRIAARRKMRKNSAGQFNSLTTYSLLRNILMSLEVYRSVG
jgi:hypothetical protein